MLPFPLAKLQRVGAAIMSPYIQKAGDPGDKTPPIFWTLRQILGYARRTHKVCTGFRDGNAIFHPIVLKHCLNLSQTMNIIIC